MSSSYPWNSVYAFAENDVIRSIDLDGSEKDFMFDVTAYGYDMAVEIQKTKTNAIKNPIKEAIDFVKTSHRRGKELSNLYDEQYDRNSFRHSKAIGKALIYFYPYVDLAEDITGAKQLETILDDNSSTGTKLAATGLFLLEVTPLDEVYAFIKVGKFSGRLKRTKRGFDGKINYNGNIVDIDGRVSGKADDLVIEDIGIYVRGKDNYLGPNEAKDALSGGKFGLELRAGIEEQLKSEGVTKVTYKYKRQLYDGDGNPTIFTEDKSITRILVDGEWKTKK
ncbi:MAG TPA: hypothetical protein ENJ53_01650 [Phaeodactylibacter sp.]|nr:hypothetical protein [Phaeodactylibacter sp.]